MTGFRLVPGRPPLYSLVLRLLLWLLPLSLALLPAILPPPLGPSLAAALTLAFTFTLRLVSRVIIGQKASVGGGEGEEEELVWDGVLGPTTWTILTPPRHPLAGFFLQVQGISSFDTEAKSFPTASACQRGGSVVLPGAAPSCRGKHPGTQLAICGRHQLVHHHRCAPGCHRSTSP